MPILTHITTIIINGLFPTRSLQLSVPVPCGAQA
jgi:hypothetical protein